MTSPRFSARGCVRAAVLALVALPASAASEPQETVLEGWVFAIAVTPSIPGETPPSGTIVAPARLTWPRFRIGAYLRPAGGTGDLGAAGGSWCLLRGLLHEDEITVGGRELPRRSYDVLDVTGLRAFPDPLHLSLPAYGAILRDLFARGVDYGRDGTPTSVNGPTLEGRLPDGRRARRLRLVTPPSGSADMYSETAFLDTRTRRYWAVREGGIAAVVQWVGPFEIPRHKAARRGAR